MNLTDLGSRICVLGPSNSGKSTLAAAIGRSRDLPVVHLDLYRHLPGTHWKLRPDDEFASLHDTAVATDRWIIEGNYSALLPGRLERATGMILLDASGLASVVRYTRRTLWQRNRVGGLEGTRDRMSWGMLRFILGPGQANRARYAALFEEQTLPKISLPTRRALRRFFRDENLSTR